MTVEPGKWECNMQWKHISFSEKKIIFYGILVGCLTWLAMAAQNSEEKKRGLNFKKKKC